MNAKLPALVGVVLLSLFAASCQSDGVPAGSSNNEPENIPPNVNAGVDQTVNAGTTVTLTGTATDSDGVVASVQWTQDSGEPVTLDSPDQLTTTFSAPATAGALTFTLTATDDDGDSASDTATVTVIAAPENLPPTVDAGIAQTVDAGTTVTLTGTATDSDGTVASVSWEQTGGTPAVTLSSTNTHSTSFTAPPAPAMLTFTFSAIDGDGDSASDTATVTVIAAPENLPPTVDAGIDQTADAGTTVTLTGTAADSDGAVASVLWTQTGDAPTVSLSDPSSLTTTFTAPATAGALTFILTATDDDGASASDSATVTVRVLQAVPTITDGTCNIGPDDFVTRTEVADGTLTPGASRLLRFVQITDEHIMDEDGQAINGGSFLDPLHSMFESAQRFQDEYTDEVMNRMIATINDCTQERAVELVVATGDNSDLGTVAEIRRFIDNLDGTFDRVSDFEKKCRVEFEGAPEQFLVEACTRFTGRRVADTQTPDPDPGAPEYQFLYTRMLLQLADTEQAVLSGRTCTGNEDPGTEACTENPENQTANRAPGLPPDLRCAAGDGCKNLKLAVPYYAAFGNHDGYVRGTLVTEPPLQEVSIPFGRHYMREQHEFIDEFLETEALPGPVGHGFNFVEAARMTDDDGRNDGYYAFNAGNGKFRMIVLNTIIDGTDPRLPEPIRTAIDPRNPFGLDSGMMDQAQFDWLKGELAAARESGKLVLAFSHHPDLSFAERGSFPPPLPPLGITAAELDAELASYPNFVAWVAGHTHRHRIRAFTVTDGTGSNGDISAPVACKGPAGSCTGFWEIETASLIDHPQEARILEIYDNGDGTGTILSAVLQHDFARSKELAEVDDRCQFYFLEDPAGIGAIITDGDLTALCSQGGTRQGEAKDRNVRLIFRMPQA